MKKMRLVLVLLITLSVISLSGCDPVTAKQLVVSNTSSSVAITGVMVHQYVGSRSMPFEDIMGDGETIAPGDSRSFYISPSTSTPGTTLTIEHSSARDSVTFTYDYKVHGLNRIVTVSFDGTDFVVSGSNAQVAQDS